MVSGLKVVGGVLRTAECQVKYEPDVEAVYLLG